VIRHAHRPRRGILVEPMPGGGATIGWTTWDHRHSAVGGKLSVADENLDREPEDSTIGVQATHRKWNQA
jgi:hypothetical protein